MSCSYQLDDLGVPPLYTNSSAHACSADGSTIVGFVDAAPSSNAFAFTYTTITPGYTLLNPLGGEDRSIAYDVSEDGLTSVGISSLSITPSIEQAVYWQGGTTATSIPNLANAFRSRALEVSAAGGVVVGTNVINDTINPVYTHVFHYTISTATLQDIGSISSPISNTFDPVLSRDGTTVVGRSDSGTGYHAFRWTSGSGIQDLGTLGGGSSQALDVSDNGGVVVGFADTLANDTHAFYWSSATNMVDITPLLPTGYRSEARCVSGDGNIVWGSIQDTLGNKFLFRYIVSTGTLTTYEQYTTAIGDVWCCSQNGCVVAGTYAPPSISFAAAFRASEAEGFVPIGSLPTGNGGSNLYGLNSISEDGRVVVGVANYSTAPIDHAFRHVATCPFDFCSSSSGSTPGGVTADSLCLSCVECATPNPQTGVYDSSRITENKEGRVIRNYVIQAGCSARPTPIFKSYADYMKYLTASLRH
jgi:probable HAF family extracellular repeat protein